LFSIISNSNKTAYGKKSFIVDEQEDLSKIPTKRLVPGSTAFVIANSQQYMLNHKQEWIRLHLNNGSSSPDDSDVPEVIIYDGGVIE
jgi:hypothetical protein